MGKKKKRPFINKKTAIKFNIVPRSQNDPLIVDPDAPENVVQPIESTERVNVEDADEEERSFRRRLEQHKCGIYYEDDYDYLQHLRVVEPSFQLDISRQDVGNNSEETVRLTNVNNKGGHQTEIDLPKTLFESEALSSQPFTSRTATDMGANLIDEDVDPEVAAILGGDLDVVGFDFADPGRQLEDDFFQLANRADEGTEGNNDDDNEDDDNGGVSTPMGGDQLVMDRFFGENRVSVFDDRVFHRSRRRFDSDGDASPVDDKDDQQSSRRRARRTAAASRYSEMTAASMPRSEQLTVIDEQFDEVIKDYDDTDIGPLDTEDLDQMAIDPEDPRKFKRSSPTTSSYFMDLVDEFHAKRNQKSSATEEDRLDEKLGRNITRSMAAANIAGNDDVADDSGDEYLVDHHLDSLINDLMRQKGKGAQISDSDRMDCETVLSLNSNLHNRPEQLDFDSIFSQNTASSKPSTGAADIGQSGLDYATVLKETSSSRRTQLGQQTINPLLHVRGKTETAEEKKARKGLVKLERAERRQEKKANKLAFKAEQLRQHTSQLANAVSFVKVS